MNNSLKLLAALAILGCAGTASAQNSATAPGSSNATIVLPITLSEVQDLNFGNIVSTTGGGSVSEYGGSDDYSADPGSDPGTNNRGTIGDCIFDIGGQPGFLVDLNFLSPSFVNNPVPGISGIAWNPIQSNITLDGLGHATYHVHGQLYIQGNASPGAFKFTWTEVANYQ